MDICAIKEVNERQLKLRLKQAENNSQRPVCRNYNPDVLGVPSFRGVFTKSLNHNDDGVVNPNNYRYVLDGVAGDEQSFNKVYYPNIRRLTNPSCIYSVDLISSFPNTYCVPPPFPFSSDSSAAEMVELYAMGLMRDVPFDSYDQPQYQPIIDAMNQLNCFHGPKIDGQVTAQTLFRGTGEGCLDGIYLSQFLYLPFKAGPYPNEQRLAPYSPGVDFGVTWPDALLIQNGGIPGSLVEVLPQTYMRTGRDGATYVHQDTPFTFAYNAACILYSMGTPTFPGNPTLNFLKEMLFVDIGAGDLFDLLGRSSRAGLMSAWYNKWTYLRIRPEAYGMEVFKAKDTGTNPLKIKQQLLDSPILQMSETAFGTYLLPLAYPEGSPTHPDYPQGHATMAGAMITVLKAFFENEFEFDAFGPSADGLTLVPLGYKSVVWKELNKLASNIAMLRCQAGVHGYSSAMAGIELGEKVAIQLLKDHIKRYAYKTSFQFYSYYGKTISISNHSDQE